MGFDGSYDEWLEECGLLWLYIFGFFFSYNPNLFVDVSGIGQARLVSMFGSTRFLNPVLAKDTNTSETNLLGVRSQSKRTR